MSNQPWQEPMAVTARRHHLRAEMRQHVVPAHILELLRQERAERVKAASTMAAEATEQEAAVAP